VPCPAVVFGMRRSRTAGDCDRMGLVDVEFHETVAAAAAEYFMREHIQSGYADRQRRAGQPGAERDRP